MASPVVVSRIQNRRGLQSQFDTLYPVGYDGIGGYGSIVGFNVTNYPNVLLPGELALCTDSRRTFLGNINGEYLELAETDLNALVLPPVVLTLPPAAVSTIIPELTYTATPFFTLLYSITDDLGANWNLTGTNFSRNGSLQITALKYASIAPQVTLTDSGTEINNELPSTINFIAEYNADTVSIDIKYTHDFPGNLTFSTTNIVWQSF